MKGEVHLVETGELRRGEMGRRVSVSPGFKAEQLRMEAFQEGARLGWLIETGTELNLE